MAPATDASDLTDLTIIGAGPAALTAAIYATRAGLTVNIFERAAIGGALAEISQIANYPGFDGPGPDLVKVMRAQAETSGAHLAYGECTDIQKISDHFALTIDGESHIARTVLIATGSVPRPLDSDLQSALTVPISYCALCDGDLVKGKNIAVVGGANSAFQESLYLAGLATHVTIISHSAPKACDALKKRIADTPNIDLLQGTEPTADLLSQFEHIFVFIGQYPATAFLKNLSTDANSDLLDAEGYLRTTSATNHATSVDGLFVAGDVRSGALRQVVTAAADGAIAAVEVAEYLEKHKNY